MEDVIYKKCAGPCGQEYPATAEYWYRRQKSNDGWQLQCKICQKEYKNQPEVQIHTKEYMAKYYSRPEIQEREKVRRDDYNNRPEVKARIRSYSKTWGKNYRSRPEIQKHEKEYANRPEVKARKKARRKARENIPGVKERMRADVLNRIARKKAVKGSYTASQIQDQLNRQKRKCYYCHTRLKKVKGKYQYHIEHTFPLSRVAGTDIPANSIDYLVLSCPSCNLSKGDKFPWEFTEGGRLL